MLISIGIIVNALILVYNIFLILYLTNAKKCDEHMSNMDRQFRMAALVITYITAISSGLSILILLSASIANYSYTKKLY
jgi:Mn2+/Fe2+ NRAMP family transporter